MNKYYVLFVMMFTCSCGLKKQEKHDVYILKLKAKAEMEQKVNHVIHQLHTDCDSNLFRMAKQKVDSLRLIRSSKLHPKLKPKNKRVVTGKEKHLS